MVYVHIYIYIYSLIDNFIYLLTSLNGEGFTFIMYIKRGRTQAL